MDFGDISARELHHGGLPVRGGIGRDEYRDAGGGGFGDGAPQIPHLIPGYFVTVRIWQMTIRYERRQLAKGRLDPDSADRVSRPPNLDSRSVRTP